MVVGAAKSGCASVVVADSPAMHVSVAGRACSGCRRTVWRPGGGGVRHASAYDEGLLSTLRRLMAGQRGSSQPTAAFRAFVRSPSVALAARSLQQEDDHVRGWTVYQLMIGSDDRLDTVFFERMMRFCKRHLPAKAPAVFRGAIDRHVRLCDTIFIDFVDSCMKTKPCMVADALDLYAQCDFRSTNALFSLAHMCRVAKRPNSAMFLVPDAVRNGVEVTHKLLSAFTGCCAEANSPEAADTAEMILRLIRSNTIPFHRSQCSFGYIVKALMSQNRLDVVFDLIQWMDSRRFPPSMGILTEVLRTLANSGRADDGFQMFNAIRDRGHLVGIPELCLLIASCGRERKLPTIEELHYYARQRAFLQNDRLASSLIDAYCQLSQFEAAEKVLAERCSGSKPSVVAYTALISAYNACGMAQKAIETFERFRDSSVRPDRAICSSAIVAYASHGRFSDAVALFDRNLRANVSVGDVPVLTCLIEACGRSFELAALQSLHQLIVNKPFAREARVANALARSYAQCGRIDLATRLFLEHPSPDADSLSVLISAYADHGMFQDAVRTYDRLKSSRLPPNGTILLSLLVACGNAGDIGYANAILSEFKAQWNISPDPTHINCLVDMFGRGGQLDEAERLVMSAVSTDALALWMTLLRLSCKHGDVLRAERSFSTILALPPLPDDALRLPEAFILMSNLYSKVGRSSDAKRLQRDMTAKGLSPTPIRTTVVLRDRTVRFEPGDGLYNADLRLRQSHSRLMEKLTAHGLSPDSPDVSDHGASPVEGHASVCMHGPVIAVAYAFSISPAGTVFATKNAELCSSCHTAMKAVSTLYQRDIHIRDAVRHHHFQGGHCSCGDYW